MRILENHFTRKHLWVFMVMLMLFTILNGVIAAAGIDKGADKVRQVVSTIAATITGPIAGAVARDFQSCCMQFSLRVLLVFSGPGLLVGSVLQMVKLPFRKGQNAVRMFFWVAGWTAWFLGIFISYLHALS
jgi:hypothetical protein